MNDLKTFDSWSKLGYKIIKGSKATWVGGVAMFSKQQVTKKTKKVYWNNWSDEEQYELDELYGADYFH